MDYFNDKDVIDEMTKFEKDIDTEIEAAQDAYRKELLKNNIDEINKQLKEEYDNFSECNNNMESLDEFLYNGDFCDCDCPYDS